MPSQSEPMIQCRAMDERDPGSPVPTGNPSGAQTIAPVAQHFERLYEMLRAIAARMMATEVPDGVQQPTAIVHDAYLRLVAADPQRSMDRALFCHAAAEEMRRVVIDHAR